MVRIRPLLPSKIKGEKPEKYMVLSLWKNCMSAVSALRQRRNKKAEKEQSRNFSRQQFQAELHCNMRRRAGRVGILDKRKGILNHVRIPGSDWINFYQTWYSSVFHFGCLISTRERNTEKMAWILSFQHRKRGRILDVSFLSSKSRPLFNSLFSTVHQFFANSI